MQLTFATTTRVCPQHGIAIFYHMAAGTEPKREKRRTLSRRERDWRCEKCGRYGHVVPWVAERDWPRYPISPSKRRRRARLAE